MPTPQNHTHSLHYLLTLDRAYVKLSDSPLKPASPNLKHISLHHPLDFERHLLTQMRQEAHDTCNYIFFPGTHVPTSPIVHFRITYPLKHSKKLTLTASGPIKLHLNGKIHARTSSPNQPISLTLSDHKSQPHNTIGIVITPQSGAGLLTLPAKWLTSAVNIESSHDGRVWLPCARIPHSTPSPDEPFPQVHLKPRTYGNNIADFGSILLARPVLTASGKGTLQLFPGESLPEAQNTNPDHCEQVTPTYTLSSNKKQTLTAPPLALRYLRIKASPGIKIHALHLRVDHPPLTYAGNFESDDPLLNQIWAHSAYTLKICTQKLLVDGIKRDRLPWSGDVYIATLSGGCVFRDHTIAKRTALALAGNPHPGGDHVNGISDYTFWWLLSIQELFQLTGDTEFLRQAWPYAVKMLDFLAGLETPQGFIQKRPVDWLFLDWAPLEKEGICASLQMIYVMALQTSAKLAIASNNSALAASLTAKANKLSLAIRKHFWDAKRKTFVDALIDGKQSAAANPHAAVFAVLSGVATPAQRKSIAKRLANPESHTGIGTPYMRFFLGLALARLNEKQAMLEMIKSYWGGMLALGATTFWEAYDPTQSGDQHYAFYGRPFGKSLCHAWAAGPAYLLSKALLDVTPGAGPDDLPFHFNSKDTPIDASISIPLDKPGHFYCIATPSQPPFNPKPQKRKKYS
jgi:alpha-L-rhamnosidase